MMRIKPESHRPITEIVAEKKEPESNKEIIIQGVVVSQQEQQEPPSEIFMNGYWDGWRGKISGTFRWTFNEEYRQGHMLGSYDRKNGIDRYEKPK
jgi:hypothetical protein